MSQRFRRQGVALAVLLCSALIAAWSQAAAPDREKLLQAAATEITGGQLDAAIGRLEAAADGGEIHPDAAFSRGVAYLRRALSDRAKPGDYGQAAAGFREALLLRPTDGEAGLALEQTRLLVARRSANQGEQVLDTLGLGERVLLSIDPWLAFWLAVASSAVTTLGLVLRVFARGTAQSAGGLLAGVGGAVLTIAVPLAWLSERTASTLDLGIVIAERAPLLDESGRARKGLSPLREGTEVRVLESRGPLLRLSLGEERSFVVAHQVRRLRMPSAGDAARP
jgi:tetratricopeptide (TPR) repeat protein